MSSSKNEKLVIDISSLTLVKILLVFLAVVFLFYVRDILLMVFIALILASAIDPSVDWLQKHKVPRILGIFFIFVVTFASMFFSFYLVVGPITTEIGNLSADFPMYWQKISSGWNELDAFSKHYGLEQGIQEALLSLQSGLTSAATNIFGGVLSFIGSMVSLVVILVMTFYLALYDQAMKKKIRLILPDGSQPYFMHLINRMQDKIGLWLRGQLFLSLLIFLFSLAGLMFLGVKYAWVLALLAGITEFIPYLGPLIGAIPAIFIAFTQSPTLGLYVVFLYIIIQQSENHLIVPLVMKKAVGLNPVVVIVAMMIGAQIAGIAGMLVAVPVTTAISVAFSDLLEHKNKSSIDEV